ncbi:MAG: nucleotide sugar dehydrogenase [Desulfovibrio sp.]|nr:nucleotide sugar dehydrogenase [Desulfovibrio sp.]
MISMSDLLSRRKKLAVVGLGYVGLPLATAFAREMDVIGYDANPRRIEELKSGKDHTREVSEERLAEINIRYSDDPACLGQASVIIIAVPTPIDSHRSPDLAPVLSATETAGKNLREGCVIIYESTVYPGLTEEKCLPILERESGLRLNEGFYLGYSPERINPGDRKHTLATITKIVSASSPAALEFVAELYGSIVEAGVHKASSIKVAEAAKVIENTQRDLNIALMNELSIIFEAMGIDTLEALEAAGTKWNFLPFRPGLVGGHCIGVDPYYLTFKAEELGFHPEVILAGRRVNDRMGKYVAEMTVKNLIRRGNRIDGCRVGILGLTFKENVPDLRNTRVIDVISELRDYGARILVHDPEASAEEAMAEYDVRLSSLGEFVDLDAVILAVPHDAYKKLDPETVKGFYRDPAKGAFIDAKGMMVPEKIESAGLRYWRL